MPLRLLADENFHGVLLRGLLLRAPGIDLVRVQDVELGGTDDNTILDWAAQNDRILLTHDRDTVPAFAYERIAKRRSMPGVIVLGTSNAFGDVIDEIMLIALEMEPHEIRDRVLFI